MSIRGDANRSVWIFGYGSLMWDRWEIGYGCTRRELAELPGYRRTFNRASIKRWGTHASPGPTLNLVAAPQERCRGMAFAFPALSDAAVRAYLTEREGLPLCERTIQLATGGAVLALVTIYEGSNLIQAASVDEAAEMACRAAGSGGRCIDYVRNIASKLAELGISDPAVSDLIAAIDRVGRAV